MKRDKFLKIIRTGQFCADTWTRVTKGTRHNMKEDYKVNFKVEVEIDLWFRLKLCVPRLVPNFIGRPIDIIYLFALRLTRNFVYAIR